MRRAKNRTDGVQAADHIPLRYILALLIPITTTLKPFVADGGATHKYGGGRHVGRLVVLTGEGANVIKRVEDHYRRELDFVIGPERDAEAVAEVKAARSRQAVRASDNMSGSHSTRSLTGCRLSRPMSVEEWGSRTIPARGTGSSER
jgi:hypothetical protein